ncbi:HET-domain-containing protein [Hyaloscypha variabilis F]|uniref:HET-domain-containing protein n=1 Tax=Hyaloscypha variabilis (strain UAMH 11265 / GT02V1 / F) TaxID=1149755 RepID=A0A2J6RJR4_HYAVF|nr:HET-domain-containing protein [Hyaloscypha variabilis F]
MAKQASSDDNPLPADPASTSKNEVMPTTYSSLPLDCEVCQDIMRSFHTPYEDKYDVDLGAAADVLSKPCPAHDPLLARLKERFESKEDTSVTLTPQEAHFKVCKFSAQTDTDITINVNDRGVRFSEPLELVNETSVDQAGRGVIPDPQWIDLSLLMKWNDWCQQHHGDDCEHPLNQYRLAESTPTWLIDVQNRCLIPGTPDMRYVTLSYKWGETERPRLEKTSLPELQKPNSLAQMGHQIPETIRNAIDLARLLGEDYIWTDSLCIAQDDEATKFTELNQMAAIYANSTLTIIAAEGEDAEHGLLGLKDISKPRELKERWINFGDTEKVISPQFPWFHIANAPYFNRGWTFQEYLFSKRRIIFEDGMVRWECSRCKWSEDMVHIDAPESKFRCNWMDVVSYTWPSLGAFGYMLIEYNHRQFTYQEDVLPSLVGLLSMISQKYEGGFLCGTPEMYFEAGLNWGSWCVDLTRRKSSGLSSASKSLTLLPSWSWIGWEGRISGGWASNEDYLKKGRHTKPMYTIPITEWYTSADPSGIDKRRIHSKFLHERDALRDHLNRPLPPGWTRHTQDPSNIPKKMERVSPDGKYYAHPPPEGCGTHFYIHDSCPDIEFWYPIPMLDSTVEPILPPQTQYLFCSTHRTFLFGSFEQKQRQGPDLPVWLRDEKGKWAGVLLMHNEADLEFFKQEGEGVVKVEVVAISRGQIPNDEWQHAPTEMKNEERFKEGLLYEFYNVLWVEWIDGIAYRRAHGRVEKGVWEGLQVEEVALVLG